MTNINVVDVITERLKKEPIGGLIKDEDVYDLVKQALDKAFVADRYVTEGEGYNKRDVRRPGIIVDMLRTHLDEAVKAAVLAWAREHKDEIMAKVNETLGKDTERLIMQAMVSIISPVQRAAIDAIQSQIFQIDQKFNR